MDFPKGHPEKTSEEPSSFLEGREGEKRRRKRGMEGREREDKEESITFPQRGQRE